MLTEFNPAGTAGSDERQFAAVFDPVQQLRAFLHNGKVRRRVNIKNFAETKAFQSANHIGGDRGANFKAEFFSQSRPDCRCRNGYHMQIFVCQGVPNFFRVVFFPECTNRTNSYTLPAIDTRHFIQGFAVYR